MNKKANWRNGMLVPDWLSSLLSAGMFMLLLQAGTLCVHWYQPASWQVHLQLGCY